MPHGTPSVADAHQPDPPVSLSCLTPLPSQQPRRALLRGTRFAYLFLCFVSQNRGLPYCPSRWPAANRKGVNRSRDTPPEASGSQAVRAESAGTERLASQPGLWSLRAGPRPDGVVSRARGPAGNPGGMLPKHRRGRHTPPDTQRCTRPQCPGQRWPFKPRQGGGPAVRPRELPKEGKSCKRCGTPARPGPRRAQHQCPAEPQRPRIPDPVALRGSLGPSPC